METMDHHGPFMFDLPMKMVIFGHFPLCLLTLSGREKIHQYRV